LEIIIIKYIQNCKWKCIK